MQNAKKLFLILPLMLSLTACGGTDNNTDARIEDLEYEMMQYQMENEELKSYVGELEDRINDLESRVEDLE